MGMSYFVDPTTDPLEGKVHVRYANSSSAGGKDSTFQSLMNASNSSNTSYAELEANLWAEYSDPFLSMMLSHTVNFLSCTLLLGTSLLWISLTTKQLVTFYTYLLALSCVPLSYLTNFYITNSVMTSIESVAAESAEKSMPLVVFLGMLFSDVVFRVLRLRRRNTPCQF